MSWFRLLPRLGRSWKPLNLSSSNFPRVNPAQKIEEETIPEYVASRYYPVRLGEILQDRYQIIGKLGYGMTSTVWLARDLRFVISSYNLLSRMTRFITETVQWPPPCRIEAFCQLKSHGRSFGH